MWALLVLGCVIGLSAGLLRRRPRCALAVLLAGSAAAAALPASQRGTVLLVLLTGAAGFEVCWLAVTRPRRLSAATAAVVFSVLTICWMVGGQESFDRLMAGSGIPVGPDIVPMTVVVAWLIGHSIRQAHVHAEQRRAQADAQAATAERLRIARELHDMVAHSIGIIAIQAGMGSRVIATQPAEAGNALAAIEATSRQTLAGLRQMLGALRRAESPADSGPALVHPASGLADISRLAATTLDAGVRIDVQWRGEQRPLPADVDQSAFRIIQEAVTNVIRHAGTGHCQVSIDRRDEELCIEVTDDGRGARNAESITPTGY